MVDWLESRGPAVADPGRVHEEGREARYTLETAREQIAGFLGTRPRQLIFTSGATESVNTATWAAHRAGISYGSHESHGSQPDATKRPIAMSAVEHSSVKQASERLAPIVTLPVDSSGRLVPDGVDAALTEAAAAGVTPSVLHCQLVNHEIGTIQPVAEIVEISRAHDVPVHVDAAAACGHVDLDVGELGADYVSVSAHKFGGPPGIGALVVRRGLLISPYMVGGEQERARRGGLENVLGAVGFAAAALALSQEGAVANEAAVARRQTDTMAEAALSVDGVSVVGRRPSQSAPHILAITFTGVEAEPVLLALDRAGIAAHSGSACSSESLAPSPVLQAIGVDADHSLRLSVGWSTTDSDVEAFCREFPGIVDALRSLRS